MIVDYTETTEGALIDGAQGATSFSGLPNTAYTRRERRVSNLSQGLYMKHLLKHLTTPNLTISEIFARLYSSFTQGKLTKY